MAFAWFPPDRFHGVLRFHEVGARAPNRRPSRPLRVHGVRPAPGGIHERTTRPCCQNLTPLGFHRFRLAANLAIGREFLESWIFSRGPTARFCRRKPYTSGWRGCWPVQTFILGSVSVPAVLDPKAEGPRHQRYPPPRSLNCGHARAPRPWSPASRSWTFRLAGDRNCRF